MWCELCYCMCMNLNRKCLLFFCWIFSYILPCNNFWCILKRHVFCVTKFIDSKFWLCGKIGKIGSKTHTFSVVWLSCLINTGTGEDTSYYRCFFFLSIYPVILLFCSMISFISKLIYWIIFVFFSYFQWKKCLVR